MLRRAGWALAAVMTTVVLAATVVLGASVLVPPPAVSPRALSTSSAPAPASTSAEPATTSAAPSVPPSSSVTPTPSASSTRGAAAPRPDRYPIVRLTAGERPPQFVVISFDGGCRNDLWQHYLGLGDRTGARFTFFLSGTCIVPEDRASLYRPPHKPVGSSVVGFGARANIPERLRNLSRAWTAGHEIGTHYLGHFCDAQGVGTWDVADWRSEMAQARGFLDDWRSITGVDDPSIDLPFSWADLRGGRTPCLLGRRSQLLPVMVENGFTYDASSTGPLAWPRRTDGGRLWEFPLQTIPVVGYGRSALSMDYNFLVVQNGGDIAAPTPTCDRIRASAYRSYVDALRLAEQRGRAPLFLGNHFNTWVCGAYRDALTRFVETTTAQQPDVRFVTFEYLQRWLDAQDPAVVRALQQR